MDLENDSGCRPVGENQGTDELSLLKYLLSERLHVVFCRWRTWENWTDDEGNIRPLHGLHVGRRNYVLQQPLVLQEF